MSNRVGEGGEGGALPCEEVRRGSNGGDAKMFSDKESLQREEIKDNQICSLAGMETGSHLGLQDMSSLFILGQLLQRAEQSISPPPVLSHSVQEVGVACRQQGLI